MKKRSNGKVMAGLTGMVKPLAGYMVLAVFLGLAGHLCAAFLTIAGGYVLLQFLGMHSGFAVSAWFAALIFCALLRGILRYGEQSCNHFIAFKLLALIRDKVFLALRRLSPAKLEGKEKGNLISIITSDIELLEVFYAHTISPVAIAILFSGIMTVFIGKIHWKLGVVAFASYLVVGALVPFLVSKKSQEPGWRFREKSGMLSSFVLDNLRGLPEIIQFGQGENRLRKMNDMTEELSGEEAAMKKISGGNQACTGGLILLFDFGILLFSAFLYQGESITFDGVLLATLALMSSFGPVLALANLGSTLQNTFAAGNRVLDILEEEPVVQDVYGEAEITYSGAEISHLTFSYQSEKKEKSENILSDVSLKIPDKQIIGITGKSGSGKSTLLKLLMRFWTVQQGIIEISKTPINRINTDNLRQMESFMTQETHLFHDSIRNNIRIAKLDATEEEIIAACKKASIHDFIMKLPNGYDTMVGELGDTLSGGEKQRIGLARAFLHNAPFLLLDEPTSNLDSLNEAIILNSLWEEREGKTILLVSHRASTMRIADEIYSVEQGRVS